jgi:hypothetical protein
MSPKTAIVTVVVEEDVEVVDMTGTVVASKVKAVVDHLTEVIKTEATKVETVETEMTEADEEVTTIAMIEEVIVGVTVESDGDSIMIAVAMTIAKMIEDSIEAAETSVDVGAASMNEVVATIVLEVVRILVAATVAMAETTEMAVHHELGPQLKSSKS